MADDIPESGAVFTFGKSHFADNEPSHFFIKNDPIVAISCGDEHSAVICQNGRVFVFGGNSWGQLGLGHKDEVTRPSCVKWLKPYRVMFVACGRAHTVFVTENGRVFVFGGNSWGQLGLGHKDEVTRPSCVKWLKLYRVMFVACGRAHTVFVTENGRVFVFGGNTWGQLGLGHKDEVTRPSCVKWLKPYRVMFVACGRAHTVFVTDNNTIYTVGCNDEGQLGTSDMEHHNVPQCVELDDSPAIRQVSAGSNHTAILTDEGRVFVCGSNTEGQLGLGEDTRSSIQFTELKFMEKIAFVECGYYHTVFITSNGAVFVTGDNENSKLGITNPATTIYVPEVLPTEVPIKSACCGASHTFLLSMDESKILAFGSNEKGQLGMAKEVEHVVVPTEIDMEKMFDGYQLKLVACGAMHTAFVTDNGLLYTCGEARHDKLCLDDIDNPDDANELPGNQYSPKRVTAMNGFIVDNVACGGCHTLLSATKGSNADFTNNDFNIITEETRAPAMPELPPLQKIPLSKPEEIFTAEDIRNSNIDEHMNADNVNGNVNEETGSIDSLEANVSGSHIVNINDLENENVSTHGISDIIPDSIDPFPALKTTVIDTVDNVNNAIETTGEHIQKAIDTTTDKVTEKVEVVESFVKKNATLEPIMHLENLRALGVPDKTAEIANSPPPKSPLLQDLLHVPDITQLSPVLSKNSDDGQKSEAGQSENETIPCGSDKSSPHAKTKTQAVLPIVRSEDGIDGHEETRHEEENDVVVNKTPQKGRFSKLFQSMKDKENSCMGKGKVIEEKVTENIHKGIDGAEETIHKIEETIETEVRNQTSSRTCTIL